MTYKDSYNNRINRSYSRSIYILQQALYPFIKGYVPNLIAWEDVRLLVMILLIIFISVPLYAFIRMVRSFTRKTKSHDVKGGSVKINAIDCSYSMVILCLFMFGFFLNRSAVDAGEQLHIYELNDVKVDGYASLFNEYIASVLVLLTLGMLSFWIIKS